MIVYNFKYTLQRSFSHIGWGRRMFLSLKRAVCHDVIVDVCGSVTKVLCFNFELGMDMRTWLSLFFYVASGEEVPP